MPCLIEVQGQDRVCPTCPTKMDPGDVGAHGTVLLDNIIAKRISGGKILFQMYTLWAGPLAKANHGRMLGFFLSRFTHSTNNWDGSVVWLQQLICGLVRFLSSFSYLPGQRSVNTNWPSFAEVPLFCSPQFDQPMGKVRKIRIGELVKRSIAVSYGIWFNQFPSQQILMSTHDIWQLSPLINEITC